MITKMDTRSDREQILEANNIFYRALGTRDLNLMSTVWVKDTRAGCVHPGWIILRSWEAIRQSWENIFDPEDQVDITVSDVSVRINGDTAWLTCIQQMVYIKRDPVTYNISLSTNIFEKSGNKWLMVIHHASPLPDTRNIDTGSTNIQ